MSNPNKFIKFDEPTSATLTQVIFRVEDRLKQLTEHLTVKKKVPMAQGIDTLSYQLDDLLSSLRKAIAISDQHKTMDATANLAAQTIVINIMARELQRNNTAKEALR